MAEPAGTLGIAALLEASHGAYGERVGNTICGWNVTTEQLSSWGVWRARTGG